MAKSKANSYFRDAPKYILYIGIVVAIFTTISMIKQTMFSFLGLGKEGERKRDIDEVVKKYGSEGHKLQIDAKEIIEAFGVNYSWFNPMNWTEDEERAYNVLVKYNRQSFPKLSEVYYAATSGRDLLTDILSYMNSNQITVIKNNIQ